MSVPAIQYTDNKILDRDTLKRRLDARLKNLNQGTLDEQVAGQLGTLGYLPGDRIVIEVLKPKLPTAYAANWFARTTLTEDLSSPVVKLVRDFPHEASGFYFHADTIRPDATSKLPADQWVKQAEGTGFGNGDVTEIRALKIDVDPAREGGTRDVSANSFEMKRATLIAAKVWLDIGEFLQSDDYLSWLFSGNGTQIPIALDRLPPTPENGQAAKRFLYALQALYGTKDVSIDTSMWDLRRVIPLAGTMKRKGADDRELDRRHRMTRISVPDAPRRLDQEGFDALVSWAVGRLTPEQLEEVEQKVAGTPARAKTITSVAKPTPTRKSKEKSDEHEEGVWARCGAVPVREVARALGLDPDSPTCPACNADGRRGDTSVMFLDNKLGVPVLKCQHQTCGQRTFNGVGLVAKVIADVDGLKGDAEAAKTVLRWFEQHFPEANVTVEDTADSNTKADRLAEVLDELHLFRTSTGRFFAEIDSEAIPVDSQAFLSRVARLHRTRHGELINKATFDSALLPLLGPHVALSRAPVRFGGDERQIVIDLADGSGAVVVIDCNGCSVVGKSPIAFYRPADTQPLPRPTFPSSDEQAAEWLGEYRDKILGVDPTTFVKIIAWQLSAMRPMESSDGAITVYTLLDLIGEEGSGKTTTARFIREPVDPRRPMTDKLPKKDDDLPIQAEQTAVLLFDNISSIPQDLSDAFCRLATGDGDRRRSLYSNRDLSVFESSKPIILTSITNTITRPDLQDRALQAKLPARKKRVDDKMLKARYSVMAPRTVGALCWCLHRALGSIERVEVPDTIRMRAPAMIATAAEVAAGLPKGSIVAAYERSKADGAEVTRLDPVYAALVRLLDKQLGDQWSGKTEQLLDQLTEDVREVNDKGHYKKKAPRGWPETPRGLTAALQRLERTLRLDGITVTFPTGPTGANRQRLLTMKRIKQGANVAEEPGEDVAEHAEQVAERYPLEDF